MMALSRVLLLLTGLVLLAGCSVPSAQRTDLGISGGLYVGPGNELAVPLSSGISHLQLEDVILAGTPLGGQSGQAGSQGYTTSAMSEAVMIPGPDGSFLMIADKAGKSSWYLLDAALPGGRAELECPLPAAGNVSFSYGGPGMRQACFMGDNPVVLYAGQLVVASDSRGNPRWTYMSIGNISLSASEDGSRLLLSGWAPGCICLNADGVELWRNPDLLQAQHVGNRIIGMFDGGKTLACLDGNGQELWRREFTFRWMQRLITAPVSGGDAVFALSGERLLKLDMDGRTIWNRRVPVTSWANLLAGRDGHAFIQIFENSWGESLLGGRFASGGSPESSWICIDPAGRTLWQSWHHGYSQWNVQPAEDGYLLLGNQGPSMNGWLCLGPERGPQQ